MFRIVAIASHLYFCSIVTLFEASQNKSQLVVCHFIIVSTLPISQQNWSANNLGLYVSLPLEQNVCTVLLM